MIEQKDFTPKELAKFNGVGGAQIYLSILGKVYDVSAKPDFYGPGSMYENFSGRDASRYVRNWIARDGSSILCERISYI